MSYSDIIKKRMRDWDCPDLMDRAKLNKDGKIPFSSPKLNWATYGGIPRNRITEMLGSPGSGKSTTAADICKNAIELFDREHIEEMDAMRERISNGDKKAAAALQDLEERGPKKVVYIDVEHGFDIAWSQTLGIDTDRIELMQPPNVCAEELLQTVEDIVSCGEVGLVVIDSIPSLVPKSELEKKLGEPTVASLAGLMTIFMRKIVSLLTRYNCTLILINQLRANLKNPYAINSPGGEAVRFYSSLRMLFQLGSPIDFLGNPLPQKTENPVGYLVEVQLIKQKTATFDRKQASYYLMCKTGIRPDYDFAKLAIDKYGIIQKTGAWFTVCDPYTGEVLTEPDASHMGKEKPLKLNGMSKVFEFLSSNEDYYKKLRDFIMADIDNAMSGDELTDG